MTTFRADHIGSLIRPPELVQAREAFEAGTLSREALTEAENRAIRDVVKLQEDAGLQVVTDGEFRRSTYSDSFTTTAISGIEILMTEDEGWKTSDTHGHRMARRIPSVVSKVEWVDSQNSRDFAYLKSLTDRTPKITVPGPGYIHYRAGRNNISRDVYPDMDGFWSDLTAAYHREMQALSDVGCSYLQIDETSLVKLGDPRVRELLQSRGDNWSDLLDLYIDAINQVLAGTPAGMKVGIHICRSQDSSWQADVGYDPIAEKIFHDINVDLYFLEYDNERSGSFEPLRLLPKDKTVILGLIASYKPELESADMLKRRIEEAAQYTSLDQLGISPQCGFSTSVGHKGAVSIEMEKAKLALAVEVAKEVWG